MFKLRSLLIPTAVVVALAIPAASSATMGNTYYVGPALYTTGACDQAHECTIDYALSKANSGDTVYVEHGRYVHNPDFFNGTTTVNNSGVFVRDGVTLQGAPGLPRPVISQDAPYTHPTGCNCGAITALGSAQISHLRIEQHDPVTASALLMQGSASIADSEVVGVGPSMGISNSTGGHASNTLFVGGTGGVDIDVTYTLDHDTIVSQGAFSALTMSAGANTSVLTVHNSIVRSLGGTQDIYAAQTSGSATINFDHSATRLATAALVGGAVVHDGGGNVAASPLFVNAAGSNFRPAAGSPTIDSGTGVATGPDLDGNPFSSGAGPDIGAYEYVPPVAPPPPPPVPPKVLSGLKLSASSKLKHGKFSVKVTCPKAAAGSCKGSVAVKQGKKTKKTSFSSVKPGKTKTLKLKAKKGKAAITLTETDAAGATGTASSSKKLK